MYTSKMPPRSSFAPLAAILAVALFAGTLITIRVSAQAQMDLTDGFMAENARAMDKMMAGMEVTPSGNVDRDFVAMMVPHHQGAIDMAMAELRYGKDETLRRMAQEIIVEQQQEIAAMKLAASKLPAKTSMSVPPQQICTSRSRESTRLSSSAP